MSMGVPLNNWRNEMTTHVQQNDLLVAQENMGLPRPSVVALIAGILWAGMLIFLMSLPLLVSAGLWMLGMGLVLVGYALVSYKQFETAVWDTAIIGQGMGLLGLAMLFGASILP
jgi:hypothetical protein